MTNDTRTQTETHRDAVGEPPGEGRKRVGTPLLCVRVPLPQQEALAVLAERLGYSDRSDLLRAVYDLLTKPAAPLALLVARLAPPKKKAP